MNRLEKALTDNMHMTLAAMCSLSSSLWSVLDKGFLLATGTRAASENWVFLPVLSVNQEKIQTAVDFFDKVKLPFIWPVFPNADATYRQALDTAGLDVRGELVAMACTAESTGKIKSDVVFEKVASDEQAAVWAETAWQSFDSPPGAPVSFVRLASGLFKRQSIVLVIAKREDDPVGTYMLSVGGGGAGVYYFATLPKARKSGVGHAMMHDIFNFAEKELLSLITLQATPAGLHFYASQGFKALFKIPVHSFSEDIF